VFAILEVYTSMLFCVKRKMRLNKNYFRGAYSLLFGGPDVQTLQPTYTTPLASALVSRGCAGPVSACKYNRLSAPAGQSWEPLPAGTFEESGTGVNAVLLTI
jgi:hypothetical protein